MTLTTIFQSLRRPMSKSNYNNEEDSDAALGEDLNEGLADNDEMELEGNDFNNLSGKDESDLYTSALCKVTLAKQ
ncbi:hypothetical protein PCASD_13710 [Puccinia coronata f. sp. avenae]|uniref:Uncharacterized protein n=1 Tax=Puccinia coronata f. sp. avenae TaxID=200324 RepID=A0A2N5UF84_9BASI|nr:hypothetical protein PCASD_14699 [Puccinia coronata f. sp. avenae]PLW36403.1 hypothetical protein PCASD_13710 [Puccinia coronata f. sp. avenae]